MEEASNGRIEGTKIEERQEVIEEVEAVDPGAKMAREVVVDSTSELVKESPDESISILNGSNGLKEEAEAKEKNAQVEVIEEVEAVDPRAKVVREAVIDSTSELVKESPDESISNLNGCNGLKEEAEAKEKNAQVEVIEEVEAVDPGAKVVREVVVDNTSKLVKESPDESISNLNGCNGLKEEAEAKEKNAQVEVIEEVEAVDPDSTSELVKEIPDESISNLNGCNGLKEVAEAEEKNAQVEEAGLLEVVEEAGLLEVVEKEVVDTVVGSAELVVSVVEKLTENIEASVEKLENSDVVEEEVKETKEKVSVSLNETDVIPPAFTDKTDGELPEMVLKSTDGSFPAVTVVSEEIEVKVLQSNDESNGASPVLTDAVSKGVEEVKQAALEENIGEPSSNADRETVEKVESTTVVERSGAFPGTTGNPPITSLRHRNLRPSWKSCCGLFEALRPSDR
ncbi:hypothetical protein OIU79_015265 [Salix purpurea]|uniref:Uncharacterized protein n=1 Tax=Salix purpurea TaxID=77065 RepID=A0A9Q0SQ22_SALPP|nr:hypothetical protein OIU79_015265 [Salix purpurea]KAJ6685155.1 hypothetical protein OIU79_015265 [Salix purpurea]